MIEMNLQLAEELAKAAHAKAHELGIAISATVVDESGRLVYCARADGAGFLTTETSRAKALAAAAYRKSTKELVELQKTNPAFWSAMPAVIAEGVLPATGAVPIIKAGAVIGAIGIGGGSPEQDHDCALAALELNGLA